MAVPSNEVSVVVQGPVYGCSTDPFEKQLTREVLASARRAWPMGEIILSTWKGADTAGLDVDTLVVSDDPGAVPINDDTLRNVSNNLNRQIVSTRAGLQHAHRPYAVKLRSDFVVTKAVDLELSDAGARQSDWCLLSKRVITLNLYTRNPLKRPVLFHLSDIFHAGLTVDLQALFSAPLVEEPAFTRAIVPERRPQINAYPGYDYFFRCAPEQYLMEALAHKLHPDLHLEHPADGGIKELFSWLRLLANNFHLLTIEDAGLQAPDRFSGHETHEDLFNPSDKPWLKLWTQPSMPRWVLLHAAASFQLQKLRHGGKSSASKAAQRVLHRFVRLVEQFGGNALFKH